MLINRKGIICHVSKIASPYFIWYPISLLIPQYGENYIKEKLGITKPEEIQCLQDEFQTALQSASEGTPDLFEEHTLRFDKYDWPFYLADKNERSVTIFLERGLSPDMIRPAESLPHGYAWAIIQPDDTPETINRLLYCGDMKFGRALCKKLWKLMEW
jgi:hypothetical protein